LPEGWGNGSRNALAAAATYTGADGILYPLDAQGAGPRFATNIAVVATDDEAIRRSLSARRCS
jgi:hypothetical protein